MEHQSDEEVIKNTRNLARFFTEQRQVSWVCLAVALAWGLYGVAGMPQRKDPDVPSRTAMVVVPWQGTKPEEVEQLVTKKVEQAIAQNQWATEIKAVSRTGNASVQFDLAEKGDYDTSKELDDIKIKLDAIHDLPKGAGPIMYIKDFGDTSALMLTVASPPADASEVAWRSKLVETRLREVRAGVMTNAMRTSLKEGQAARVAVVVAYPNSIDAAEVERAVALVAEKLVSQQLVRDGRIVSGPGFSGMDFASALSDADLLANVRRQVNESLQSDEFHPDAWGAAVIRDPAKTEEALAAVAGDKYTYRDLDDFTETIQRSVKTLPIVSKADRSGVLDERILLDYSQERLAQYKLKPSDISNIISSRNLPDAGGTLNSPGRALDVTTSGEFKSADGLRGVIIKVSKDGAPLYLRDLVDVTRGYETPPSFLNHFTRRDAGGKWIRTRAVTLSIQMRKGQQINVFGKQVNANLDAVRKTLPSDLVLARTSDQPLQVKDSIDLFSNSLIEALVLVVIVAWIGFWSWRTALLMLAAMPITLAITFGVIHTLGIDLQQVSIASLIIALGLLVDVPVVSGDAIERELSAGKPRPVAAWLGPTKLFKTMAFATLTNIVSYLPFLLLPGDTGKFLYSLPVVISVAAVGALSIDDVCAADQLLSPAQ